MKIKLLFFFLLASSALAGPIAIPTMTVASSSGTVTAGYSMVSMATSSDFAGTILGAVASPSSYYTFPQFQVGNNPTTLGPIVYTISAGSIQIMKVQAK